MKLKFKHQAYQANAVDAVADCFAGQSLTGGIQYRVETKGSMSSMELREIEQCKIKCAKKFFSKITFGQAKYDVVDSYGKLMELVK